MKKLSLLLLALSLPALAQDVKKSATTEKPKPPANPASPDPAKPGAAELEAKFIATLTKATLAGRWCSLKDGQLGPEKADKYVILSVAKISGDDWVINTRMKYGNQDVVAPLPVQVKWAGDTAVLIVDKLQVPGGGTYSARVLIYENTYAGTWTGGDHGGLLNGAITNEKP